MGIYLGGQQVVTYAGGVNSDIFATEGYVQEAVAEAVDGLATEEFVKQNGGKIDSISVNGVAQTIDGNKNVNITVPETDLSDYSTTEQMNAAISAAIGNAIAASY